MSYLLYKFKLTTIFEHWPNEEFVVAEMESKARFLYWQKFRTKFLTMPMVEFMKFVKCENEGVFDIKRMYSAEKAFKKMQNYRSSFCLHGYASNVAGMWGMIVGNWKTHFFVLFDGEIEKHNCHPFREIAYYDDEGNVVRNYQKGEYVVQEKRTSSRTCCPL
ncbi:MFS transporter [Bacillus wiedmannii]|uniref:MFS transporter n=1 Tax=Bacillus TaxID=1386 RepID=UPI000AB859B1|nr:MULTISPECIES: MFS transporter [Bacillus]MED2884120.1 MFS transporter [Bacillus wiedmannii]MED3025792.1 MFS transporter [Bacillus wiedmannii]PEC60250.1 MFS transporter [Bacillus wiedmannii]PEI34813.1 MFS transporter [Bacillus wiedmannii]PEI66102.1 MFS transporter [Bacillus wiedmannii]